MVIEKMIFWVDDPYSASKAAAELAILAGVTVYIPP